MITDGNAPTGLSQETAINYSDQIATYNLIGFPCMWMDFPFQNISDNEFGNLFQTARCDKSLCQELNNLKCNTSENRNFEDQCLPKRGFSFQ